jgi:hypothetical protein
MSTAVAQVPDGYYVFTTFGTAGRQGVFLQHPRNPDAPIPIEGLNPDLAWNPTGRAGGSCVQIRASDGALLVGERAEVGNSVDLHVIRLDGTRVVFDQLFSAGTAGRAGEIPQLAELPDGRILIAATDLTAGPLANVPTNSYGLEGIGIVDPIGGGVTPVPITNPAVFQSGVFNALTASPDGQTAYIGNYVSTTVGEVWALPIPAGGNATLIATVTPVSHLGFDLDGNLMIVTLNGPPNVWKHDFATNTTSPVTTTIGPLNAIGLETVTGNFAIATANGGVPPRSLLWVEPDGTDHLIVSPNFATISGVDVRHNPRVFGDSAASANGYAWRVRPNPGGLPLIGSSQFSLTLDPPTPTQADLGVALIATAPASAPIPMLGVELLLDPNQLLASVVLSASGTQTLALPIPADSSLAGVALFFQGLHLDGPAFTATAGLRVTLL